MSRGAGGIKFSKTVRGRMNRKGVYAGFEPMECRFDCIGDRFSTSIRIAFLPAASRIFLPAGFIGLIRTSSISGGVLQVCGAL